MRYGKILLAAVGYAALITPAFAQDEPADNGNEEEVVVTAQLRAQDPIDVPIALTAYDNAFLEMLSLDEFDDVGRFVPGFDVQNEAPNNPGFVMRGITSDTGQAFAEPRVSIYQDGVAIGRPRGAALELFDLERVEIAKGPQTTLYGRGALIGAVNIIQNKARFGQMLGEFRGDVGNEGHYLAEGMLNLPVGDHVALRVAGRIKDQDGYVDNLLGGADFNGLSSDAVRGVFSMRQGGLRVDIIGNAQWDRTDGTAFKSILFNPTDPVTGAVLGGRDIRDGATLSTVNGFEDDQPLGLRRNVWGVTGLAELDVGGGFTLSSISAYRKFHADEIFDADGISLPVLAAGEDAFGKQTSQEFRLVFDNEGPITALAGVSYFHESGSQRIPIQVDERLVLARLANSLNGPPSLGRPVTDPAPLSTFGDIAFTSALLQAAAASRGIALSGAQASAIAANLKPGHRETLTNFSRLNAYDVFADVTWKVAPNFEIGAGARYTHSDKESSVAAMVQNGRSILGGFLGALEQPAPIRDLLFFGLGFPGAATIPMSPGFPLPIFGLAGQPTDNNGDLETQSLDDDGFTWRLTARYAPNDASSIYAAYSRGRRPKVLSAQYPTLPFGPARFDVVAAETVDSFEVGAKARFSRELSAEGAAYYYKYNNFQTTELQGVTFVTTNAGNAEAYGFEGQLAWTPSEHARLFATYGYNHSRFKTGLRDGNRFRLSPDHSASLGAVLSRGLGKGILEFIPTVTYQSKIFFDDDNDLPALQQPPLSLIPDNIQDEYQDGFALVGARVAYETGMFRFEAFVENLFDKDYVKDAGNTGNDIGLPTFVAGEPRFYGLSVRVKAGR
jgi:outer membrane receptor protein involved in Fe transport